MFPGSISQICFDYIQGGEAEVVRALAPLVVEEIVPLIPSEAAVISIDGWYCVGKTTIASALAKALDAATIDFDGLLLKNQGSYFNAMKFDEIADKIRAEKTKKKRVILSGCLMSQILIQAQESSNFNIYVMRVSRVTKQPAEDWIDKNLFQRQSFHVSEQDPGDFGDENASPDNETATAAMDRELEAYHLKFKPLTTSHLIVKRFEEM